MRKILIIGASGSGKSQTTRFLLADSPLPTFVLNDRDRQHLDYTPLEFDQVLDQSDCNVVVEDLIDCTKEQLAVLQTLCNFNARHNRIALLILVAHSITKNGIAALLQYLTHVLFMTTRSTVGSLAYVLTQYQFPRSERRAMQDRFLHDLGAAESPGGRRYGHWVLDVEKGTFEPGQPPALAVEGVPSRVNAEDSPPDALRHELRRSAEAYVLLFAEDDKHGKRAMAVLDYILAGLADLRHLDRTSLEFHFRGAQTGQVRRLSLLDYVNAVTTSSATVHPNVLALHAHLVGQGLCLPRSFVKNAHPGLR
jgi:hypothetical protein